MSFDKHITPTAEQLQQAGVLDTAQALRNLELITEDIGTDGSSELLPLLLAELSRVADPDMALNYLERFTDALGDIPGFVSLCRSRHDILRSLITLFGASRFLATFIITNPDERLMLLSEPAFCSPQGAQHRPADRLAAMVPGGHDDKTFFRLLRLFRKQEMLRIGLRDLLGKADLQEIVADLSDLAEACLQKAYEWGDSELRKRYGSPLIKNPDGTSTPAGFAVIAMGKLGGRELNFSSDVDLMYVYTADGETEGVRSADDSVINRITNHQYFIKLAEKISAAIGEKTGDGFVFRVDLRLRPEGQRGPLAQSLGGYEIYYESWGQTWERSALIKARPVAGDKSVGDEFMERITPFVFRKYLDYSAISEIRDMKQKINKDVELKGRTHRDVKLGYGGIREIEFVIQALQLIYAGRDRKLREKNALKALHALSQKNLISHPEHEALSRAYVFLRTVEHRIQLLDDLQTQTMPSDGMELRTLARRTGYFEQGREAEQLLHEHAEQTRKVRTIYDDLFAFTGENADQVSHAGDYDRLLDPETTEGDAVAVLTKCGFRHANKAFRDLLLLREGAAFVHRTPRSRRLFNDLFPSLFQVIVSSPDPDMALNHLEGFLAVQGSWEAFQSLVRLDASAFKVLIAIFANSEYLSRMLISRPEYLQNLLDSRRNSGVGTAAVFRKELGEAMEKAGDITDKLDVLRRFKHQEEIRIGMADLLANIPLVMVSRDLSKLAEACLDAAFGLAAEETGRRYAHPGPCSGLAVIGVGKLGGRELTYGSDLDIVFVFSGSHAAAPPAGLTLFEYFSKVSEKTISYLSTLTREGFVFRVDARLRPTGSKGPLVQSIDAIRSYYAAQAETWERQALLRSRCVAGDRIVGDEFCRTITAIIYRDAEQASLARDVLEMRLRMQDEAGKGSESLLNIKQGAGGLVDIEFIVQYLQLLHGKQHPRIRVPGTYNALRALAGLGLLDKRDSGMLLRSYLFIQQLVSRTRIVSNQATSDLTRDPKKLLPLARRMGYAQAGEAAGQQLLDDYVRLSAEVREVFDRLLGKTTS